MIENDRNVLVAVESLLHKTPKKRKDHKIKEGIMKFAGIWGKKAAAVMRQSVEKIFENLNPVKRK